MHRCGLLLQMLHAAWSACLCLCVCCAKTAEPMLTGLGQIQLGPRNHTSDEAPDPAKRRGTFEEGMSPASLARWTRPVLAPAVYEKTQPMRLSSACGGRVQSPLWASATRPIAGYFGLVLYNAAKSGTTTTTTTTTSHINRRLQTSPPVPHSDESNQTM